MYWVDGLYTITVNGVPTFQGANPGAGIPFGTQITAQWLDDVQGELLAFLTKAGIAPAQNTPDQALASVIEICTPAPLYIASSGGVLVPGWATRCFARLWAGGGSGSVGATSSERGAGGGAGGYIEVVQTGLAGGSTLPITVGAGGIGVGSGAGNPGGYSSIGAGATATGGQGGGAASPSYAGGAGGSGAIASGFASGMVFGASDGSDGDAGSTQASGNGGGPFGGRGAQSSNGLTGHGPGGGGGGCTVGFTSGNGADGLVVLKFMP